jgi:signal peptidase II
MSRKALVLTLLVSVISIDQLTKYLADTLIQPGSPVEILPVLHLVNVRNIGAAFGLFKGLGNAFFIVLSLAAIAFISILLIRGKDGLLGLSLILAGAAGNLLDRLIHGHVRDFIDLSIGEHHWPAFNVADSALTIGIAILLITALFKR